MIGARAAEQPIEWASLRCAYGSAERVPELLTRAEQAGPDFGPAWDDLWSHLCHQGTVYSASYAAVPALAAMCRRYGPRGYLVPLQLVGSIIASNDGPEDAAVLRGRYAAEVGDLQVLAERCIQLADDDVEFIYGLETLVAFEDRGTWARNLSYLADGEVPLACLSCGENLLVSIDELPAKVACWDASRATTMVAASQDHGPVEQRLLSLAVANNRASVAERLPCLFGNVTCPDCGADFAIGTALP